MQFQFHTVDVFTETRFGGNPLAVVLDAGALSPEQMQIIARELNVSETVFVLPPERPAHSARMRIFTPAKELPFAGHPTVGTAALLAELRTHSAGVEQDALDRPLADPVGAVHKMLGIAQDRPGQTVLTAVVRCPSRLALPDDDRRQACR